MEKSDFIGNYMGAYHEREIFPASYFGSGTLVEFEGEKYYAPQMVNEYLSQQYGNYMELPPAEKQVPKHHILRIDFEE